MYKDGMGNSLNHKMEELEEIKKMDGWMDRYTGRMTERQKEIYWQAGR
jgi:hypothetical protein